MDALTAKQKESIIGIRVDGTGRVSQIPPFVAPYNFGIDPKWWRKHAKTYPNHITDFFTHGDLDGFATSKNPDGESDGAEMDGDGEDTDADLYAN